MIPITKAVTIAAVLALVLITVAFAKSDHGKPAPAAQARTLKTSGIVKQDLFDRNNPNNLRSVWPGPSAQPGQF